MQPATTPSEWNDSVASHGLQSWYSEEEIMDQLMLNRKEHRRLN